MIFFFFEKIYDAVFEFAPEIFDTFPVAHIPAVILLHRALSARAAVRPFSGCPALPPSGSLFQIPCGCVHNRCILSG
jgi:hypothetical protein